MAELRYGQNDRIELDIPSDSLLGDFRPQAVPLDDPAAAVAAAAACPIDFPPLSEATVPGDRIVIALDQPVPLSQAVVAGLVHVLLEGPAKPADITVVQAAAERGAPAVDPRGMLSESVRGEIELLTHDPADTSNLSYLAASRDAHPIYLNRTLFDADVVIPVGVLRLEESLNYLGIYAGLFPAFSDEKTQQRFRTPGSNDWVTHRQQRREEASEAAWLLGAQFTVQVVPGPGESLLHVLAGQPEPVSEQGTRLCQAIWRHETPSRASLVVASIDGGQEQQTWSNFARALYAASRVVQDDGTICLCTKLDAPPGPALQRLTAADGEAKLPRQLQRDRTPDALAAQLLFTARQRARVLLLSGLDGDTVEDLGMGYVERPEDIARLSRQHASCILLACAQHAVPVMKGEREQAQRPRRKRKEERREESRKGEDQA